MPHRQPTIGFAFDAGYVRVVETYRALLGNTAYADCPTVKTEFNPRHPQQFIQDISRQQVTLAHIGAPGKPNYEERLHAFMDAYAAAKRPPVMALVTHDGSHTGYVVEQWLERAGTNPLPHPPTAMLTIVEARKPLESRTIQLTLDLLLGKRAALFSPSSQLSEASSNAIPSANVAVESLSALHKEKLRSE